MPAATMTPQGMDPESARQKHGAQDYERALKAEIGRLIASVKTLRVKAGDREWLVSEIDKRFSTLSGLPPIANVTQVTPKRGYQRPLQAVGIITDPHFEEVVDPNETEGLLEWNLDKALLHLRHTVNIFVELTAIMRAKHRIDVLHLMLLGDMVTGEIHSDVFFSNSFYLPDALVLGPWYFAQAIRELSAHFKKVYVTTIVGNHGRLDQKPMSKRVVGRNWDTCFYSSTAVLCRDLENVEFRIPRSPKCVVEVNGWYFLLQHGDRVPQHGGTMPYYGMARQRSAETTKRLGPRVRDVEARLKAGLLFDYDIRGHSHIFGTVDERTLLCPSLMGNNEFGADNTFAFKTPGSRFFCVDKEHGLAGDWRVNYGNLPKLNGFQELPKWKT